MDDPSPQPSTADDLMLDGFAHPPMDQGLSLDDLSESFARLLGQGQNPYEEAHEADAPESLQAILDRSQQDDDWPVTPQGILEAILFVGHPAAAPISARSIASLMQGVRATEVNTLVDELNEEYENSGCPYRIERVDHGLRLVLRDEYNDLKVVLAGKARDAKLSQAAIDVLAVVAYQQPIAKTRLQKLLGDSSLRVAGQLIRRGLLQIRVDTPREESGDGSTADPTGPRPPCYATTDRFLALFGLNALTDLPTPQDLDRL